MSWQEDLHRRNMAESAATRARINSETARANANNRASIARDAAQREQNHQTVMNNLRRPVPNYFGTSSPSARREADWSGSNNYTPPSSSSAGKKSGSSVIAALGMIFLGYLASIWAHDHLGVNGTAGYIAFFVGIGVCFWILYALRKPIVFLLKVGMWGLIAYGCYWLFAHR